MHWSYVVVVIVASSYDFWWHEVVSLWWGVVIVNSLETHKNKVVMYVVVLNWNGLMYYMMIKWIWLLEINDENIHYYVKHI